MPAGRRADSQMGFFRGQASGLEGGPGRLGGGVDGDWSGRPGRWRLHLSLCRGGGTKDRLVFGGANSELKQWDFRVLSRSEQIDAAWGGVVVWQDVECRATSPERHREHRMCKILVVAAAGRAIECAGKTDRSPGKDARAGMPGVACTSLRQPSLTGLARGVASPRRGNPAAEERGLWEDLQNLLAVVDVCPEVTHQVGTLLAGARAISEETALVRWSDGSLRNVEGDGLPQSTGGRTWPLNM